MDWLQKGGGLIILSAAIIGLLIFQISDRNEATIATATALKAKSAAEDAQKRLFIIESKSARDTAPSPASLYTPQTPIVLDPAMPPDNAM